MSLIVSKGTKGALLILGRCIRAPIRALGRARDFYVSSMTGCAGRSYNGGGGGGGRGGGGLAVVASAITLSAVASRSGSCSRSRSRSYGYGLADAGGGGGRDEDFSELVRAASRRAEEEAAGAAAGPRRSRSVAAIGRIDEDREFEFRSGGGDKICGGGGVGDGSCKLGVGMRSRSCAVVLNKSKSSRVGNLLNL